MLMRLIILMCLSMAVNADDVLFVLAGQSNMCGHGVSADLPPEYVGQPAHVTYLDTSGGGMSRKIGGKSKFGPEVALAHELAEAWPGRDIWIVKYCRGGTEIVEWTEGGLFAEIKDAVDEAGIPAGATYGGFVWMQGEKDARLYGTASVYRNRLTQLLAKVRRLLPEVPFIVGEISVPTDTFPYRDMIRDAQRAVVKADYSAAWVDTDSLTQLADDVHFDTDGQIRLGKRFAKAVIALTPAPPT